MNVTYIYHSLMSSAIVQQCTERKMVSCKGRWCEAVCWSVWRFWWPPTAGCPKLLDPYCSWWLERWFEFLLLLSQPMQGWKNCVRKGLMLELDLLTLSFDSNLCEPIRIVRHRKFVCIFCSEGSKSVTSERMKSSANEWEESKLD